MHPLQLKTKIFISNFIIMKTNKKLKLNTKKVVILSNEQQNAVQGGYVQVLTRNGCMPTERECDTKTTL